MKINAHYRQLEESYLFSTIARKRRHTSRSTRRHG